MALTLDIDGELIQNPSAAQIADAFQSLEKGGGFFGPGISIAILSRAQAEFLMASGTRDAGLMLSYQDGDPVWQYEAGADQAVSFDEAIRVFQAYAAGDDWGRGNLQWEREQMISKWDSILRRLLIIGLIAFVAYIVVKKFIVE